MNWTGLLRWCHWRTCHSWWLNGSWTSGIRKERWLRHITSSNSRSKPQNNHQLNVIRWQIIWQNERSNYSAKCFIFFFSFESKIPGPFLNSLKWRRILFCVFLLFFIVQRDDWRTTDAIWPLLWAVHCPPSQRQLLSRSTRFLLSVDQQKRLASTPTVKMFGLRPSGERAVAIGTGADLFFSLKVSS